MRTVFARCLGAGAAVFALVALLLIASPTDAATDGIASAAGPGLLVEAEPPALIDPAAASPAVQASTSFVPIAPARVFDSRNGVPLAAGEERDVPLTGVGGVPAAGVAAVAVNVTGISPTETTFVAAYPADVARPDASTLNFFPGQIRPNLAVVGVSGSGAMTLYNEAGVTHVAVDVMGWFPAGGDLRTVPPQRLLDTRSGLGTGVASPVGPAANIELTVAGRGDLPAGGVGAVVVNLTAVSPTADTYLTVWPTGAPLNTVSNLNLPAGDIRPNLVFAPVGADGRVSIFNAAGATHVLADLVAWYPTGASYTPVNPTRVLDTRDGTGIGGVGPVGGGDGVHVKVTGVAGIPASGVGAVALNLTGTAPTAATYLTAYPSNLDVPCTSNLNLEQGQTAANLTLTAVDPVSGTVRIANAAGATHIVADVAGWYPSTTLPIANAICGGSLTTLWRGVPQQNPYVPPPTQLDAEETDDGALRLATTEDGWPEQHISEVVLFDAAGTLQETVSVGPGGSASNGDSGDATMTPDGRYVAFSSVASNLVAGDTNGVRDVFVRDRQTGSTVLVSRPPAGVANGLSDEPSISADGRYVAFRSAATNLVTGFDPGTSAVFRWDRTTGAVTRISATFDGPYAGTEAEPPIISRDGSTIAHVASPRAPEGFTVPEAGRLFVSTAGSLAVDIGPALVGPLDDSVVSVSGDGTLVAYLEPSPATSSGGLLPNRVMLWTRGGDAPNHLADLSDAWHALALSADGRVLLLNLRTSYCEYVAYNRVTRQSEYFRLLPQTSGNTCYSNAWLHPGGQLALFAVNKFNYISGESESFVMRWSNH